MKPLFLYGPPGSGKTTLGKLLAERLALPFCDLDVAIQERAGRTIPQIFAEEGEAGFRARERRTLEEVSMSTRSVIALGGGSLLDPAARAWAEAHGTVVCLTCPVDVLKERIRLAPGTRPLVAGGLEEAERKLADLMARRAAHYASFPVKLDVAEWRPDRLLDETEVLFGAFRILSGDEPSDVVVGTNLLDSLGDLLAPRALGRRCVVVADANTAPLYAGRVAQALRTAGFTVSETTIPAGETEKTLSTVASIWRAFLAAGLARDDFAVAVGGGVTGDLTGFAAATWMRGMRWVNLPTTLLAMVDASTGGKTGCDLPEAKNMIGAFHSPSLVVADVTTLATLNVCEVRCGLAEVLKHAFIADPSLVDQMSVFSALRAKKPEERLETSVPAAALASVVSRALAVKVACVRRDPREQTGERAKLNLGHTVGHAVEIATDFQVKHGEGVSIGTVEEARLAVRLGRAPDAWPDRVASVFAQVGLPTELPHGIDFASLAEIMRRDKKKKDGKIRFALPLDWGDVALVPVEL